MSTRGWRAPGWTAAAVVLAAGCGPPVVDLPVTVRGHLELRIGDRGETAPLLLGLREDAGEGDVGLCVTLPDARDTSRWEGTLRFDGRPSPTGAGPPAARLGRTLCFDGRVPADLEPSAALPLCLEVHDLYDGSRFRLPCAAVAYLPRRTEAFRAATARRAALLARIGDLSAGELSAELDALATEVAGDGFPMMAVNLELIAVHYLTQQGTAESRTEAQRRLTSLPDWVERPEAGTVGATVAFQRAELQRTAGAGEAAWRHLEEADRRFLRLASPRRFTVAMRQASMLARRGAGREARRLLRSALADCRRLAACPAEVEVQAQSDLAWYVALDPDATEQELEEAARTFEEAAARLAAGRFVRERAIQRINHGFVLLRLGRDPAPHLAAARELLAEGGDGELTRRLLDWTELAAGLHALGGGDPGGAVERCRPLTGRDDALIATWALSCVGRAERLRGDLAAADRAFTLAVGRHAIAPAAGGSAGDVSPGPRAEDFAHAARVAVERGEPGRAWRLLDDLDRLTGHEEARRACGADADEEERARRSEADREARALQRELAAAGEALGGARDESLEPLREHLRVRLRELTRRWPGCAPSPSPDASGPGLRALPLEDEVILLQRDGDGTVRVARRTSLPRRRLGELADRLDEAMAERELDEAGWRELAEPLAAALLPPDPDRLEPVTAYSLHGPLQRVPVAALPLPPGSTPEGHRWLGEATAVALRPAAAPASSAIPSNGGAPLFVIDPRGDLASRSGLEPLYRSLFPRARVLAGEEATAEALLAALPDAAWVHVDAHGGHEPGFPELSSLRMADRPLPMLELAARVGQERPLGQRFVNLGACRTGRWPVTADSGRYGIGGLLVRLGVPFVLAAAGDLDDRVAAAFNRDFNRRIAAGESVPDAYRGALRAVARRHPPAGWAPLLLLRGAGGGAEIDPPTDRGAEIASRATPPEEEADPRAQPAVRSDGEASP